MANMKRLKGIMAEAGFSQRSLAKEIGMGVTALNAKVNEKSPFNVDEAQKICEVLGITDPAVKCHIFLR
jgi:transcriptional regulator with XRE-family HTH domain